jgi:apolipoprotein N-acyltransferase
MHLRIGISFREGIVATGAGLLGAAAFPPLGLWPLSLVSIYLFLSILRDRTATEARSLGMLYGFVYGLGTMYWFFGIFGFYAISLIALMAGYFGLLATLIGMTRGRPLFARAALVALFAVAVEWLRGDAWYLRFPWYTVPHALAASPAWIAPARWVGTYGLSYGLWFIAAASALGRIRYALAVLLIPASSLLLPSFEPPDRQALIVQAEDPFKIESLIDGVPTGSFDLAALPEYAFPFSMDGALASKRGPRALARKLNCPVVFGTVEGTYGDPDFQNVAAVIGPDGTLWGTFPKQRPVPLMVDGRSGSLRPVFPLPGDEGTLGVAICYDFDAPAIAASLVRQGATVLVAPTGDLMPWGRIQHVHHEMMLRLRAVENDRWIVRPTSSGRSEAIDPHGVPSREQLDIGASGRVTVPYAHRRGVSLGGQAHILGPIAGMLAILVLMMAMMRGWRDRRRACKAARFLV